MSYEQTKIAQKNQSKTEGSHHIYFRPDIPELVNLQNVKGQAKPYQMRQFLKDDYP